MDFRAVTRAYAEDVLALGGSIATGCGVERVQLAARALRLSRLMNSRRSLVRQFAH